jgi:hypothetical protein
MVLATEWDTWMVPILPYAEEDRTNWTVQDKRASTDAEYGQDWTNVGTQQTKMPRINKMRVSADGRTVTKRVPGIRRMGLAETSLTDTRMKERTE